MKKFAQIKYLTRRFVSKFVVTYETDNVELQVNDYVVVSSAPHKYALAQVVDLFEPNDLQVKEAELVSETGRSFDLLKREIHSENDDTILESNYRYYGEEVVSLIPRESYLRFAVEEPIEEDTTFELEEDSAVDNVEEVTNQPLISERETLNAEKVSLLNSLTNEENLDSLFDRNNQAQNVQDIRTRIREIDVRLQQINDLLY